MESVKLLLWGLLILSLSPGCRTDKDRKASTEPIVSYDLQIQRYASTDITSSEADSIIRNMNSTIQEIESSADFPCPVKVNRIGDITPFEIGTGTINSRADFTAVNSLPGNVKVVNQINWCDGIAPNIIGCAPVPGDSLVVVRYYTFQEGILWLHEFGHNKGLDHRDYQFAVMNETIDVDREEVNEKECEAYLELGSGTSAFQALMSGNRRLPVKEFVRQTYFHGVPYAEAAKYDSKDISVLLEMLGDPKEESFWSNIVVTLGIIGDERALQPLIDFIENDPKGQLSRYQYTAKTSAVMALGYFINKTGNKKALNFLSDCAQPHFWSQMNMQWKSPFHSKASDRDIQLSTTAILGLALCGREEATRVLQQLQTRPSVTDTDKKFQIQTTDLVKDALTTCETIAKKGLKGYYKNHKK